ncbi:MAG: hydantoinase/carbamoylase family amidase, partial [Bacillus sp. (in: firmicutes)]
MNQVIHVNRERIKRRITELSKVGRTPEGGVTRKALTQEEWEAQELVAKWMEEAGLVVRRDSFGNLIGRKEGTNPAAPTVMIGSHVDTVPNGGDFDGTIGVIAGIEVAQIIENEQIPIEHSLEIVAFSDEEGTRFQGGLFGSRAMVGKISDNELSRKDEEGVSRFEALQAFRLSSLSVDDIKQEGDVKVYLEMHIEQGPYLEKVEEPVGIVTGIAGPAWLEVKLIGESGHAGTVPMSLRRDPLAGAAEIIWNI